MDDRDDTKRRPTNQPWRQQPQQPKNNPWKNKKSEVILVSAYDIVPQPHDWLWEGHLLRGSQELLTGIPGIGKSQVQISQVATVTTRRPWPDGTRPPAAMNVVMLTAEDHLRQQVIPRLMAAGADLNRVHFLKAIRIGDHDRQFLLSEDLDELQKQTKIIGNVGLITIDPITAYMGGKMDSHKATEVRSQLGPLKDFAEQNNIAISTITHPPKNVGARPMDYFIGSQAFIAAGRIAHICVPQMSEPDDDGVSEPTGKMLYLHAKHNVSGRMDNWAFEIEKVEVRSGITATRVAFDAEPISQTTEQALAVAVKPADRSDQDRLQTWLKIHLEDGPQPASRIHKIAMAVGFTKEQIYYAKEKLGIDAKRQGGLGADGDWMWSYDPTKGPDQC